MIQYPRIPQQTAYNVNNIYFHKMLQCGDILAVVIFIYLIKHYSLFVCGSLKYTPF